MPPSGLYLTPLPTCISSTRSRESQTRRMLPCLEPRQGRPQAGARGPGKQVARARALERGGAWRQQNQTATFWFPGIPGIIALGEKRKKTCSPFSPFLPRQRAPSTPPTPKTSQVSEHGVISQILVTRIGFIAPASDYLLQSTT